MTFIIWSVYLIACICFSSILYRLVRSQIIYFLVATFFPPIAVVEDAVEDTVEDAVEDAVGDVVGDSLQ